MTEKWVKLHSLHMTPARPGRIPLIVDKGKNEQLSKINHKISMYYLYLCLLFNLFNILVYLSIAPLAVFKWHFG